MQVTLFSDNRASNMKCLILLALAAACYAGVADHTAQILKFESEVNPDGYAYSYETSNGIAGSERGVLNNPNSQNAALFVQGQYSYAGEDGRPVQLSYVADENGFQPTGEHLPTPPPTPEAIARALAYIEAHPSAEDQFPTGPGRAFPPSQPARVFPPSQPAQVFPPSPSVRAFPPPRFSAPPPTARFPPSRSNTFGSKPAFGKF